MQGVGFLLRIAAEGGLALLMKWAQGLNGSGNGENNKATAGISEGQFRLAVVFRYNVAVIGT